jgi:hypothetical protein
MTGFRSLALLLASVSFFPLSASTPQEFWPTGIPNGNPDVPVVAAQSLELQEAIQFQGLFAKIFSGTHPSEWSAELKSFTATAKDDPVSQAIQQVALVWMARVEMKQIDGILKEYYGHKIRFPGTDEEFQSLLPASLSSDPWGRSWVYSTYAPEGFSGMAGQRYHLAPERFPKLATLDESLDGRQPIDFPYAITPRDAAGKQALEFRSSGSLSVIEPGGKVGSFTLLYIGEKWALLAGIDQVFAVTF